ncbi:putative serine/threonine-protein kinase SIS8 [Tasmannia lanceolata]|uniref:putative serine/threonine-protein kinase SIS8 n=1 Tax=Tasmannia lanceolata TaxID=3420 RepID=UPI0040632CAC
MKNLLKKLHIGPNQSEYSDSSSSKSNRSNDSPSPTVSPSRLSNRHSEQMPLSGFSGWLNSKTNRHSSSPPLSCSNVGKDRKQAMDGLGSSGLGSLDIGSEMGRRDSESRERRDPELEEEYQVQIALELSAREDPEAVQIEAVKQISLGSCPPHNTPAEVVAYRYWNYNAISYDDKILDGFYDLFGILAESTSEKMPSLVDLQGTPVSDSISWEAVLVNRVADADLLKLEQRALMMAVESRSGSLGFVGSDLVRKIAALVADYMGGPVGDPDSMLKAWRNLSNSLRASVGNMVLPLGQLKIGLARHRALLFKVLADSVGLPCRLVKGQQYTGSDDVAMNFVNVDDGREYIVDLMADPGTLIPSDATIAQVDYEEPFLAVNSIHREVNNSYIGSPSSGATSSIGGYSDYGPLDKRSRPVNLDNAKNEFDNRGTLDEFNGHENVAGRSSCKESSSEGCKNEGDKATICELSGRPVYPFTHARSPSWTEGLSSPAARRMKVKDVSQYMIDAAKENPQLAQKLHDVLLESGVVAPANLFTEICTENLGAPVAESKNQIAGKNEKKMRKSRPIPFLPPLPNRDGQSKVDSQDLRESSGLPCSSQSEVLGQGTSQVKFVKHVPVAAAAATAAVVASSMVVAAAKSAPDSNLEVPVAAAATATAAAVMATTAAVTMQYDLLESCAHLPSGVSRFNQIDCTQKIDENEPQGSCRGQDVGPEPGERISDKSTGNDSVKSDVALDDVAEWEIPWEEITRGERIGMGSYGEVYRGDWHGTEVAVKKFLDQGISGDALEEFRKEVWIMKRLRHPNVVLFMGAVTRAPNLSIVTEFLPRGSLYRLIHRPNNQLDERRRLRMALDVARGMNYLHNCTPVIVHRDLKSPNLLVDKNWVVKVCDFGLSRIKHNTFLSSRSTAGTAEWMAPEVLRNEPSDEKCDVYSFGIILWELSTLQQPWGGMNPMQVVGAVGFQHRRLDVPEDMDPFISDIIKKCWQTDPKMRPSFSEIMAALKPLQKPITTTQVPRPRRPVSNDPEKGLFQGTEDPTRKGPHANHCAAGADE